MPAPTSPPATARAPRSMLIALFLASAAVLHLEVGLMKLISLKYYSVFVYAVIGVAMLGYGASGSLLAVVPLATRGDPVTFLRRALLVFAAATVPTFLLFDAIRVPALQILGPLSGVPWLVGLYALLATPFFVAGLAVAGAFAVYPKDVHRLYFADLIGAAAGGALAVWSLTWWGALGGVALSGALAAAAGVALSGSGSKRTGAVVLVAVHLVLVVGSATTGRPRAHIAPDKHGPIVMRAASPDGLGTPFSRWSTFGRVDVTDPFDSLSPQFGGDVTQVLGDLEIEQRMLTLDGAAPAFLFRVPDGPEAIEFLKGTSQSPAYRLRTDPSVLIIGMGGATDVLIALAGGARQVKAIEINPVTVHAVRDVFGSYIGDVLEDPRVRVVVAEGRSFAAREQERYDIVQLSGVDTGAAQGAFGLGTMPESYVYTVEAVQDFLQLLEPDGMLSITRDLQFNWALRLTNVVRDALLAEGLDPGPRIAIVKGKQWGWATLLVKLEPFTADELASVHAFSTTYDFPILYDPLAPGDGDYARVVANGATFKGNSDLRSSVDDWPFFFFNVRWDQLVTVLRSADDPLTNSLRFLVTSLAALSVAAIIAIGVPLVRIRGGDHSAGYALTVIAYFGALGAAFMLGEVSLMQRLTVFLGNPILTIALVLTTLLVTSGIGSRIAGTRGADVSLVPLVAWIAVLYLILASAPAQAMLRALLPQPMAVRAAVSIVIVAAAGLPMGMLFPTGLARLARRHDALVPWAWGINAIMSVISSLGSYLLGMALGYSAMFVIAALLYATTPLLARRL